MSGMYPNIMADVNSRYPIQMGLVTGFLAQAAALGTMLSQPVMGLIAERVGLTVALAIPALLLGLMTVVYLGVGPARSGRPRPRRCRRGVRHGTRDARCRELTCPRAPQLS